MPRPTLKVIAAVMRSGASEQEILAAIEAAGKPPPKKTRTYRRRDMQAEAN